MLTSLWLVACGIDPARVPAHQPYAASGAAVTDERFAFALVGATRSLVPGKDADAEPILADLRDQVAARDLDLVVLTGGYVRKSGNADWDAFDARWNDVLAGPRASDNPQRVPVLALPGPAERWGDKSLSGYGAAFPKQNPDIGLGRVASWGAVDVASGNRTWRLLWLDPDAEGLGSRWQEQQFWLPKTVKDGYDHLIVLLPDARYSTVADRPDDPDGHVAELLGVVDEHSPMSALVGVFSGGPATNELMLPTGAYGEAHLIAGNAGVPGAPLAHGKGEGEGALAIDAPLDSAILGLFDDKGEADVPGYWIVEITGGRVVATFRLFHEGACKDVYAAKWTKKNGWVGGPPVPPEPASRATDGAPAVPAGSPP